MNKYDKVVALAIAGTLLKGFLWLIFASIIVWLSYRVAKLMGHWEYGLLSFLVFGYLMNISLYLSQISQRVSRKL